METLCSSEHLSKDVAQQLVKSYISQWKGNKALCYSHAAMQKSWVFPVKDGSLQGNESVAGPTEAQGTDASQISKSCY